MIKKFNEMLFENNTEETTKDVGEERIPEPEKKVEKPIEKKEPTKPEIKEKTETVSESVHLFSDFIVEGEGGGGVAYATAGNTGGMGAIVAPQPSSRPGDVAGSTKGSGDLPAYDFGKSFDLNDGENPRLPRGKKKKKKKSKTSSKLERHQGTNQEKEDMYVTTFTDWVDKDITN